MTRSKSSPKVAPAALAYNIWASSQTAHAEILYNVAGARVRVKVYADSYVRQSWARAERWDGSQWREVASLAGERMASSSLGGPAYILLGSPNPDHKSRANAALGQDAAAVLAAAMLVLEA